MDYGISGMSALVVGGRILRALRSGGAMEAALVDAQIEAVLSDLEVEIEENVTGELYEFAYQIEGGGGSLQLLPDYCFAHTLQRFGFVVEQPHTSATLRTRTLWSILSTNGFSVGVVGWPLTIAVGAFTTSSTRTARGRPSRT